MKLNINGVLLLNEFKRHFMHIEYLPYSTIDKVKWDRSILSATNGLIYACSWYLDCIAPEWDALIADDYEFVFPVTIKRKYKLPYIVQPFLAQQLGLFSHQKIKVEILQRFLARLPSYSYQINLNYANNHPEGVARNNLIIPFNRPYEELANNFSKNTVRNIQRAKRNPYSFKELDPTSFLETYYSVQHNDSSVDPELIQKVVLAGVEQGQIRCCGLVNLQGNIDCALAYADFNGRITYLFPVSTPIGKQNSAMFLLVDNLLRKYAGKKVCFDFEGSSIEGIARFYNGFGAINQPYQILKQLRPSFLVGKL